MLKIQYTVINRDDSYRSIPFMNIHDVKSIALITLICIDEYKRTISCSDNWALKKILVTLYCMLSYKCYLMGMEVTFLSKGIWVFIVWDVLAKI